MGVERRGSESHRTVKILLDTHFLIWILTRAERIADFPWLDSYRPWVLSPISLLELQYLSEIGRIELKSTEFLKTIQSDHRFVLDEISSLLLVRHALPLNWTRDPFDRLLAAHSLARNLPLCSVDRVLKSHHSLIVPEI